MSDGRLLSVKMMAVKAYCMTLKYVICPNPLPLCLLHITGDIKELFQIKLRPGHAAAFASDCDLPSSHEMVRSVGMQVSR